MIKLLPISFFLIFISSFAQVDKEDFSKIEEVNQFKIPDSLQGKSYKFLRNRYYQYSAFPNKADIYVKSYIKKTISVNDSIETARGYFFLSSISQDTLILTYLNKAIDLSKNFNGKWYPALLYYNKGKYYSDKANYKKALDNYFISYNIAKAKNPVLAYDSRFSIGSLKNRIGKHKEALEIFKEFNDYILSKESEYPKDYYNELIGLFALSDSYTRLKKLDTATTINKKGIKIALLNNDNDLYHYFMMNEGVNLFFKKRYKNSIDSIKKAIPNIIKIGDQSNEMFSRFYLGKSYMKTNKVQEAIHQFKIIDTLFNEFKDLTPEIREGYKILIDFYKVNKDKENQLLYLNRLISVDSVLNNNYKYINEKIIRDFDTSNLILEKENLILDLNQSNIFKSRGIIILLIGLIGVSIFLIVNYNKRKRYKRKFEELIKENTTTIAESRINNKKKQESIFLSEEIVKKIKIGLDDFKSKHEYLNQNISINILAKQIDSNSKYLSVYINHYEQKKFTDYINDLRITYTIEKLKTDRKFRRYTIKAIAETVGFSNPVSFSQAFYKKTGIKPSYFIKNIENKPKNEKGK